VLAAVALLFVGAGAWAAAARINAPLARPFLRSADAVRSVVPGGPPELPWPSKGQGAIAVPSIGLTAQSGPEAPVPIASLTKMTTAVVILEDHPLPPGAQGPSITVTSGDMAEYDAELHLDESTVAIQPGETLTERQMLEALLLQSANDIAFCLATWDAGTVAAFTTKMNALAASLEATDTHYVDASGYEPQTVSSASDVLRVAAAGVELPAVTLPLVGTVRNIVTEVGTDGIVGIKSGYTSQAGACLVLAADRTIRDRQVMVLVAVLGQPTPPPSPPPSTSSTTTSTTHAGTSGPPTTTTTTTTTPPNDLPIADPFRYAAPTTLSLLAAARASITPVLVASPGQVVGTVSTTWGGTVHLAPYVTATGAWLPGWPGQRVASVSRFASVAPGSRAGTRVGTTLFGIGSQFEAVALKLAGTVPEPSVWWRLVHG
jgi:D-alanyl-D-alanine carboxypeptidase (penicillin-binding protein 5/6)